MKNKVTALSPTKPDSQFDKGATDLVEKELSEKELSVASGGNTNLSLHCATGKHFPTVKIT